MLPPELPPGMPPLEPPGDPPPGLLGGLDPGNPGAPPGMPDGPEGGLPLLLQPDAASTTHTALAASRVVQRRKTGFLRIVNMANPRAVSGAMLSGAG